MAHTTFLYFVDERSFPFLNVWSKSKLYKLIELNKESKILSTDAKQSRS